MRCSCCGKDFIGPVHLERGRIVCWPCWDAARSKPRILRLGYWWRVLRCPRVIDDADLLD